MEIVNVEFYVNSRILESGHCWENYTRNEWLLTGIDGPVLHTWRKWSSNGNFHQVT